MASTTEQGYNRNAADFDKRIKLLLSVTAYAPNEADLKTTASTYYTIKKPKSLQ